MRKVSAKAPAKTSGKTMSFVRLWFAAVGAGGFGFGLIAARRPFGDDILAHPLVLYFFTVTAVLLVLRIAARRPVPDLIPERALAAGCVVGLGLFLAGNFAATHLLSH
jgi:hypothetical protein